MANREFTDSTGRRWRVWDTTAEALHPATKSEDYMQAYGSGWLTFERSDGGEKRRLAPIPGGWEDASDAELDRLRGVADRVRADSGYWRNSLAATGEAPAGPGAGGRVRPSEIADSSAPADAVCTTELLSFLYPGGQHWSVCEVQTRPSASTGAPRKVLRFTSSGRHLDLLTWPSDWAQYTVPQLVELMRRAFPRAASMRNPTAYTRRYDDATT